VEAAGIAEATGQGRGIGEMRETARDRRWAGREVVVAGDVGGETSLETGMRRGDMTSGIGGIDIVTMGIGEVCPCPTV
jgi:hypothetical protein